MITDATHLLSVEDLVVRYGPVEAVRGASLVIGKGEIVTLLGANGAGKSSYLNAIMGLVPVQSGSVYLEQDNVTGLPPEKIVRRGMTLCPEGRRIFSNLTVLENLAIGAALTRGKGGEEDSLRADMLGLFPILSERREQVAGTLSGGEQQMLALARAMMSGPRILLLDEPSLGLAPQVVETIFDLIVQLKQRGVTILLVEQNVDLALEIADRGYVLSTGAIRLSGSAAELRQSTEIEHAYLGVH